MLRMVETPLYFKNSFQLRTELNLNAINKKELKLRMAKFKSGYTLGDQNKKVAAFYKS